MEEAVDIRYCFTHSLGLDEIAAAREMLSPAERARHDRFVFARDRRDFAVAHAMLRCVLSAHHPAEPSSWRFVADARGKPELPAEMAASIGLTFNLTHTDGLVACAVTRIGDIGIDVETIRLLEDPMDLAARYFSSAEVADLEQRDIAMRETRFIEIWTLKEAYIKALGQGLSAPLDQFTFVPEDVEIRFEVLGGTSRHPWRFALFGPSSAYRMAVAVRGKGSIRHPLYARAYSFSGSMSREPLLPLRMSGSMNKE